MANIRTLEKGQSIAKPFLKWAGGKTQLIGEISRILPVELKTGEIDTYVEPFVGGGAIFFHIAQNFRKIQNFYLFDINKDLVNAYVVIKKDVALLIPKLKNIQKSYLSKSEEERKEYYLGIRRKFNNEKSHIPSPSVTAKLIFLNRTCFNGLYRVNKKGSFNVPFGRYKNPRICDAENLLRISKLLEGVSIQCADFKDSYKYINNKTFVYFDPPYRPLNKTASFTSYSIDSFSETNQIELADFCKRVDKKGAYFLLSNSDPHNEDKDDDFFERQYQDYGFEIKKVKASRAINCKAAGRGQINELLITNYEHGDCKSVKRGKAITK